MSDLLEVALAAHGGLERWDGITSIDVAASITGEVFESRDDPERSFDGQVMATPWDDIHVAYFSGEALWAYLTAPFLYTWPGFVTEEITSIQVCGETWRRLKSAISRSHQNPYPRADFALWSGRAAAPPGLHRRYPRRRIRIELCLPLSGSRRDHHPHQATDLWLEGRLPARPGAATDRHRHG
ncbi:MAG: hypothetical protein QOJ80_736 [Mycobacterium sp.]|jgi:hypothetical protein|nr:hypothetical protein [Pseudonocardiales bacterium]MDT5076099.1 hypothetical protein [Mycobacterium sp.]